MKKVEFDSLSPGDWIVFEKPGGYVYEMWTMGEFECKIKPGDVALVLESRKSKGYTEHFVHISQGKFGVFQGWISTIWSDILPSISKMKVKSDSKI